MVRGESNKISPRTTRNSTEIKTNDQTFLGVGVAAGAWSFFMFVLSTFFISGDAPGLAGVVVADGTGEPTGDATGLAAVTGAGVEGGLFSGLGSQPAKKAVVTASEVVNISFLIIFLLERRVSRFLKAHGLAVRWRLLQQPDDRECLSAKSAQN